MNDFVKAYVDCALWTESPEGQHWEQSGIAPETYASMIDDCMKFVAANTEHVKNHMSFAGHDFWLTRNGHGSGFWDGDWPEQTGNELTKSAKSFGPFSLYMGDDGKIHGMRG